MFTDNNKINIKTTTTTTKHQANKQANKQENNNNKKQGRTMQSLPLPGTGRDTKREQFYIAAGNIFNHK